VLQEVLAVIGGDDDESGIVEPVLFQGSNELAELVVDVADTEIVEGFDVADLLWRKKLGDGPAGGQFVVDFLQEAGCTLPHPAAVETRVSRVEMSREEGLRTGVGEPLGF